jgi:uncharacterized protein (TIGR02996 family)
MHEGFLDRIRAEPDQDVHRLVYADFLDEHGDSDRAEFIRCRSAWHGAKPPRRKSRPCAAGNASCW